MAQLLLDSKGNLKPFEQWRKEVLPIASHQVGTWLRTEYDTAVIRAHQAADWRQFEREKDILPNLRWVESTSIHPGLDHKRFWGRSAPSTMLSGVSIGPEIAGTASAVSPQPTSPRLRYRNRRRLTNHRRASKTTRARTPSCSRISTPIKAKLAKERRRP